MRVLRENLKVVVAIVVVVFGGWLILMSLASSDGNLPLATAPKPEQSGTGLPRLDRATPEPSNAPVQRWASSPMPPPSRDGTKLAAQGPVVTPSASSVVIGTEITIRGQDFAPGGLVSIDLGRAGGNAISIFEDLPVNRDGTFAFPFQAGAELPPGEYTIVARAGGKESRAALRLVGAKPVAAIDPSAAKPGQALDFAASGFAPGESVRVYLDTLASVAFLTVQADERGSAASSFTVPMAAEGEHMLVLVGAQSQTLERAQFTVIGFYPWVDLSSYASQPEISLDFLGHNFAAREEVWVYMDAIGGSLVGRVATDNAGEFAFPRAYFVPAQAKGDHKFFFVGSGSQKIVDATFNVLPYNPSLKLFPYAGKAGSKLSLSGEGYARGETLRAYWGPPENGVLIGESKAGADGSFRDWGGMAIPFDADIMLGGANITVVGELSQAPVGVWYTLVALTPSAELTMYSGPPGVTLQFSGNGFAPTEKVMITLADNPSVLAVAQANDEGSFENAGSFNVPTEQTQDLEFVFTGALSNAQARTNYHIALPGTEPTP